MTRQLSPLTHDTIVRGTLRLLSGRDFGDVTTRMIARESGVSEATIFRYFRHKSEILESILSGRALEFFAELDEVVSLVDGPLEKLVAMSRRHAHFGARNRDLIAVMQREASYRRARPTACAEGVRNYLDRTREILRQGIAAGVFRDDLDLDVTAMAFHGIVPTVMNEDRLFNPEPMSEEVFVVRAESYCRFYLWAIRRPLSQVVDS